MHNEKLSALMDGEPFDSELFNDLSRDVKLQQSWQRYHLIRDVIRGDAGEVLHLDIADRVAAAIAEEPVRIAPQTVKESQPAPETWQKSPFWRRARPFTARIAQFGIASHLPRSASRPMSRWRSSSACSITIRSRASVRTAASRKIRCSTRCR